MLQEISNPFGIFEIGLTARYGFDVLRIDQQELKVSFLEVPNGSPRDSRCMGASGKREPISQRQDVFCLRPQRGGN